MWCKSHDTEMKKIGRLLVYIICILITIVIIDAGKSIEGASMLYYCGWFILATICLGIVKELSVKF
jgi:hypothetical protein